ncbi:MAG TPA: glutathione S-transferase N-terminal domain-containing protein [Magnetospirillaceae bacterium]|jgi:glutathione S-transferase
MKLRYSPTSPYVRKVRIMLIETGLDKRVELVPTFPWAADTDLGNDNPIGKVPTLIDDDGNQVFDSRVIVDYLDAMHGGARLIPAEGKARLAAMTRQSLGDGMLDAAILWRVETGMRPEELRWTWWLDRQLTVVRRGLDRLEAQAAELTDFATIGDIAIACVLGYIDFRLGNENWRANRPKLAVWYERQQKRPSMIETAPKD